MIREIGRYTWELERPGAWVSELGRVDQVSPGLWRYTPSLAIGLAYPHLTAAGTTMASCAAIAGARVGQMRSAER